MSSSTGANQTKIVGIYGVSGVGKSYVLKKLQTLLNREEYAFFEGSDEIARVTAGGLQAFKLMKEHDKIRMRELAISGIRDDCAASGRLGVVAGHFMIWSSDSKKPMPVCTGQDLKVLTHIIYLYADVEDIEKRRDQDKTRTRPLLSREDLNNWQEAEKTGLQEICYKHSIQFTSLCSNFASTDRVVRLLENFKSHTEQGNLLRATRTLQVSMSLRNSPAKSMLVLDADRTLTEVDTGALFWQHAKVDDPLKPIFSSPLGYSYAAFRQASLLYDERYSEEMFETACEKVASDVAMYPTMEDLLRRALTEKSSGAVIVTCGLQLVWKKILHRHGLHAVPVLGAGRLHDLVVDMTVKAKIVTVLRNEYEVYVTAFGDSPTDLRMLAEANRAIVVVGDEKGRSKTMDLELSLLAQDGKLTPEQAIMVPGALPRVNAHGTPFAGVSLTDPAFLDSILNRVSPSTKLEVILASDESAAKLLMTPTRDATIRGPALRKAHEKMGWYLTTEFLGRSEILGLEEHKIDHVQGGFTTGHRIKNEATTLIIALMRGGEPLAFGVSEAMPLAAFMHASKAADITANRLNHASAVILVDSVINNGGTMIEHVQQVDKLKPKVPIVMMTGVVQSEAIKTLIQSCKSLQHPHMSLVALRKSDNKYTGKGITDTGHRLFNTTYLD